MTPKQNICFDVSGPYPLSPESFKYSLNAICKATGKRWRQGGRNKSDAAPFLQHLIARLNNTASPPGRVETFTSDHGGEVLSNAFRTWSSNIPGYSLTAKLSRTEVAGGRRSTHGPFRGLRLARRYHHTIANPNPSRTFHSHTHWPYARCHAPCVWPVRMAVWARPSPIIRYRPGPFRRA